MRACVFGLLCGLVAPALAADYPLPPPGASLIGELGADVSAEADTLVDIARRNRVGFEELALANPAVDHWLPGDGTPIVVPTRHILPRGPRSGIVVNLAEYRLYYYPPRKAGEPPVVETYAVSLGRDDWRTPNARTSIAAKLENPAWYPNAAIRREHAADGDPLPAVVPAGPDNPLGPLALKLAIPGGYFIHGTSKPFGIGMSVTHGCLRLYPEDMADLFARVKPGTAVRLIDQPYKTAWQDGVLSVEAHPRGGAGGAAPVDLPALTAALRAALGERHAGGELDEEWLESFARDPRGVPVPVPLARLTRG